MQCLKLSEMGGCHLVTSKIHGVCQDFLEIHRLGENPVQLPRQSKPQCPHLGIDTRHGMSVAPRHMLRHLWCSVPRVSGAPGGDLPSLSPHQSRGYPGLS